MTRLHRLESPGIANSQTWGVQDGKPRGPPTWTPVTVPLALSHSQWHATVTLIRAHRVPVVIRNDDSMLLHVIFLQQYTQGKATSGFRSSQYQWYRVGLRILRPKRKPDRGQRLWARHLLPGRSGRSAGRYDIRACHGPGEVLDLTATML